jgi:hypothetical protein
MLVAVVASEAAAALAVAIVDTFAVVSLVVVAFLARLHFLPYRKVHRTYLCLQVDSHILYNTYPISI